MRIALLSPETLEAREPAVLADLFTAGLERYHVRKPGVGEATLAAWLASLPAAWRSQIILHSCPALVDRLGFGGRHWRDDGDAPADPTGPGLCSRACHDLPTLAGALGRYDAVLVSPLFPSHSKPGRRPDGVLPEPALRALLRARTPEQRRTTVYALGGVDVGRVAHCADLGFDGVAVLGAIWQAADPLRAYLSLRAATSRHAA